MIRKLWMVGLVLVVTAAVIGGCGKAATPAAGTAAPGEEKVLNLFAWSEYVPKAMLDGFTAETGIKVNYDAYSSNEEMYAKISAGASGYDIIQPSDYWVGVMSRGGYLRELDLTKIPNLVNVDPSLPYELYDPGHKYTVPWQWGSVAIAVNTDKILQPVTTFTDLLKPEFAGRIVLLDDERQVIGAALLALGYSPNTTDATELEKAKQMLLTLVPGVKLFDSDTPSTALLTGEADIGLIWNGEAAIAHKENPAITYIYPSEGTIFWYDNMAIVQDATHPEAALAFLNYMLKPEASLLITQEFPYSNPNLAALNLLKAQDPAAYEAYMAFPATNAPPEALANAFVLADVGSATEIYDKIWTEIKTAAGG
jgi:spermidine/putrescine-binding protein